METGSKNLKIIIWLIWGLLFLLVLRLGYIQLFGHNDLSEVTRMQSMISLTGSDTRGAVLDRNGVPLAGNYKQYIYIIKSDMMNAGAEKYLNELNAGEIDSHNDDYRVFSSSGYNKEAGNKLKSICNAYILQASSRYGENPIAEHFIGYVNKKDQSGAAGIELMYDKQLSALNRRIYVPADVTGNILQGGNLVITSEDEEDSSVGNSIITNIDSQLQAAIENILEDCNEDCGVVVLDTDSGGLLAMASTPEYDPDNISKHISSGEDELLNKVTQGEYPPGSVFKIIVAAAALEYGISDNQSFICTGSAAAEGLNINCETGGDAGHGSINMEDAFAQSCNSYFVQLAQKTGADEIIDMAEKFGLGNKVLNGFPHESAGYLMNTEQRMGAALGNLGIGQGETLVTPLQIAAMTNIIAAQGKDTGVNILMGTESETERVISSENALKIKNMMIKTSETGTAAALEMKSSSGKVLAAVKTGTAEYISEDITKNHAWITGFAPCEKPEYTITVFVENGKSGAGTAGPIFKKIIEYLQKSGSYSRPTLA